MVYIEKYFAMVNNDINECELALEQSLPDSIRSGLEDEDRKLKRLREVLEGEGKSVLHSLRAKYRWERDRLRRLLKTDEKSPQVKVLIEELRGEINKEMVRRGGKPIEDLPLFEEKKRKA